MRAANLFTSVCSLSVLFLLSLSILTEYIKGFRKVIEKFTLTLIAVPGEAEGVSPQLPTLPCCSHQPECKNARVLKTS